MADQRADIDDPIENTPPEGGVLLSELVSDRTVDVHVRHLRQKLEENPTDPRWIATVRGVGYMFQP